MSRFGAVALENMSFTSPASQVAVFVHGGLVPLLQVKKEQQEMGDDDKMNKKTIRCFQHEKALLSVRALL
jgi:hypothetical protein